jgi:hypothetical protein
MTPLRLALAAALAVTFALPVAVGHAAEQTDLRDLRVGMKVSAIPAGEYVDLICAAEPARKLDDWSGYRACPAEPSGERAVGFHFNDELNPLARVNDTYEGTKIAGHPVALALLINEAGEVAALRIDTDPHARLFWRKKAFLLARLVKVHYGEEGWTCRPSPPAEGETPVGGLLIKDHCEKSADHRRIQMDQFVYRRPGQSASEFVNETHVLIRLAAD